MTDDAASLGERLCACRQLAGLSQEQLAERSGLSIRAIRNLERDRTRWPHPDSVHRLADALGLRGEARQDFVAAFGRRLPRAISTPVIAVPAGPSPVARGQIVPRQLPGQVRQFVGRERELAALTGLLGRTGTDAPPAVVISAIGGTAGVGKTALAVHWAHRVAAEFPDGQLYANLRGYDMGEPASVADVLAGFLRALGMAGQDIPADVDECAAAYRSRLAGRRMLVVLDNARLVEQIRPLVPGSPTCLTIVTSRDALAGLVARDGALRFELDTLPLTDAVGLLRGLIGRRAHEDPDAAVRLAGQCSRLPLALRVAAELAVATPGTSLADLAAELADLRRRLDLLESGGDEGTAVRTVFSWSYRYLDAPAARAFRLAGLHPGPDFDASAAAALTGTTPALAGQQLRRLAGGHLIQGGGPGRYGMHDLLRGYARELAEATDGEPARQAALTGLFDYYLHAAAVAMNVAFPAERHRRPGVAPAATPPPAMADEAAALAWLAAELPNLVAAATHMASGGWPGHATQLSATLFRYLDTAGHFSEASIIHSHARQAARRTGDRPAEAESLIGLGLVDGHQGRIGQATAHFEQALARFREVGDQAGQARALNYLGLVHRQQGRYQQAAAHLQQALALFRAAGERTGEAYVLSNLGGIGLQQGRYREATGQFEQALTGFHEIGDRHGEATVLTRLGQLSLEQDRHQQATGHLEDALTRYREVGDRQGAADVLAMLGRIGLQQGRYREATGQFEQALAGFREIGDPSGEADTRNGLGEVLLASGHPTGARVQHATALTLATLIGAKHQQARAHDGLAAAYQVTGESAKARHHWQEALTEYASLGFPEADRVRALLVAGDAGQAAPARPGVASVDEVGLPAPAHRRSMRGGQAVPGPAGPMRPRPAASFPAEFAVTSAARPRHGYDRAWAYTWPASDSDAFSGQGRASESAVTSLLQVGYPVCPEWGDAGVPLAGRPLRAVPPQRLVDLGAGAALAVPDRPAAAGGGAAHRVEHVGVAVAGAGRVGGLGEGPLGAVPAQRLVQDGADASADGPVFADGPAVARLGAGHADERVVRTRARPVRVRRGGLGPFLAVPVQRLVQIRSQRAVVSDPPAVAGGGAGQAHQPVDLVVAGAGRVGGLGEGPLLAVPAQGHVQQADAAGVDIAVDADSPAVLGRGAADALHRLNESRAVAAGVGRVDLGPFLAVPVQCLVQQLLAGGEDAVVTDGPAVTG
jgi:tetratricopeptide (TPR) repeat protein